MGVLSSTKANPNPQRRVRPLQLDDVSCVFVESFFLINHNKSWPRMELNDVRDSLATFYFSTAREESC